MDIVLTQFLIIVKSINWFRAVFFLHRSTWEMQRFMVVRVNFRVQSILYSQSSHSLLRPFTWFESFVVFFCLFKNRIWKCWLENKVLVNRTSVKLQKISKAIAVTTIAKNRKKSNGNSNFQTKGDYENGKETTSTFFAAVVVSVGVYANSLERWIINPCTLSWSQCIVCTINRDVHMRRSIVYGLIHFVCESKCFYIHRHWNKTKLKNKIKWYRFNAIAPCSFACKPFYWILFRWFNMVGRDVRTCELHYAVVWLQKRDQMNVKHAKLGGK